MYSKPGVDFFRNIVDTIAIIDIIDTINNQFNKPLNLDNKNAILETVKK